MNLQPTEQAYGAIPNIVWSDHFIFLPEGVTFDASKFDVNGELKKIVPTGQFIAKITASGKYGAYRATAAAKTITGITFADGVATATTDTPHLLRVGDTTTIAGVVGAVEANGARVVTAINGLTFSFVLAAMTGYTSDGTSTMVADGTAICKGILTYDVDVTLGDSTGNCLIHGVVKENKLPVAPDATIKSQLPGIFFV